MLKPLLGPCDSYQLEPFSYLWAWEMARQQEANTWSPEEIQVGGDVADYKSLNMDPRHRCCPSHDQPGWSDPLA